MTVKEFIKDLRKFKGDRQVRFATGPFSELVCLSIYKDDHGVVWIDIGDETTPEKGC